MRSLKDVEMELQAAMIALALYRSNHNVEAAATAVGCTRGEFIQMMGVHGIMPAQTAVQGSGLEDERRRKAEARMTEKLDYLLRAILIIETQTQSARNVVERILFRHRKDGVSTMPSSGPLLPPFPHLVDEIPPSDPDVGSG